MVKKKHRGWRNAHFFCKPRLYIDPVHVLKTWQIADFIFGVDAHKVRTVPKEQRKFPICHIKKAGIFLLVI